MKLFKNNRVLQRLEQTAKHLRREITTLFFAFKDPRTPLISKFLILLTVAYALSPIDLVPDFIPVLGLLDDLVILPLLIYLSLKAIPSYLHDEFRAKADAQIRDIKKIKIFAVITILLIWTGIVFIAIKAFLW
jgi:uncharacterized membrane protein YkvA (DUF1232 family)